MSGALNGIAPGPELRLGALSPVELDGGIKLSDLDTAYVLTVARKAYEVRALQRAYFAGQRDKLEASKSAERELDKLLGEPAQGVLL